MRAASWVGLLVAAAVALGMGVGCGGSSSTLLEPEAPAPAGASVAELPLAPLVWAYDTETETRRRFLFWREIPWEDDSAVQGLLTSLEVEGEGWCEAMIRPAPAELVGEIDVTPPGGRAWIAHRDGACSTAIGEPVLLIGQTGLWCDAVLASELDEAATTCLGAVTDAEQADVSPVAVLSDAELTGLSWVASQRVAVEPEVVALEPARLSHNGVSSELIPDAEWTGIDVEAWSARLESGQVTIYYKASIATVRVGGEAAEERGMSWFVLAGDDPSTAECSCMDWESETQTPDCVDDYAELTGAQIGWVEGAQLTVWENVWDYLRGALVQGDRMEVVVTGYLHGVAVHRRTGPSTFEHGEMVFAIPSHEEDNELPPYLQAPYCGP